MSIFYLILCLIFLSFLFSVYFIVEPYCPSTRLRPKSSDSNTSSSSTVQRAASSASTASSNASSTNSSFASGSNNALAVINGSGHNNQNAKKREDLTSLGSDDSGKFNSRNIFL